MLCKKRKIKRKAERYLVALQQYIIEAKSDSFFENFVKTNNLKALLN